MSRENGLADPSRLKPFDSKDKGLLRMVIETPPKEAATSSP